MNGWNMDSGDDITDLKIQLTSTMSFSKACRTKFLFKMTKLCKKLDFFVWISNTLEFSWEAQACFFLCLCPIMSVTVYSIEMSSLAGHASMSISVVIHYRITGLQYFICYLCNIEIDRCFPPISKPPRIHCTMHIAQVLFTLLSCLLSMPSKIHEQFCDLGTGVLHRPPPW